MIWPHLLKSLLIMLSPPHCLPIAPEWSESLLHLIINHIRADWLTGFFKFFTLLGEEPVMIFTLALFYWFGPRKWAKWLSIGLSINILLNLILKAYFQECRPLTELWMLTPTEDYSFPSGHAQAGLYLYVGLALCIKTRVHKLWLIAIGVLIALSRVYLGVHYPHDILLGGLIGSICILFSYLFYRSIELTPQSYKVGIPLAICLVPMCHFYINDPGLIIPIVNGGLLGYVIGLYLIESRYSNLITNYDYKFFIFACLGMLTIWKGFKTIFISLELEHVSWTYLRYAAVGFWVSFAAQWFYSQLMGTTRVQDLWKS